MTISTALGNVSTGKIAVIGSGGCLGYNGKNGNRKEPVNNAFAKFPASAPVTHFIHEFYKNGFNWGSSDDKAIAMQERFLLYIVNESPWAVHHHHKTIKDLKANGAWIDIGLTGHELMQACSAMRLCQERETLVRLWDRMVQAGVHPNIALLLSYGSHVLFRKFDAESNNVMQGSASLGDHEVMNLVNLRITGTYAFIKNEILPDKFDCGSYASDKCYNQHIVGCMKGKGNKHLVSYINKRFLKPLATIKKSKGLRGTQVKISRAVSEGMLIGVGCQLTAELELFNSFVGFEA